MTVAVVGLWSLAGLACAGGETGQVDLSPAHWPADEIRALTASPPTGNRSDPLPFFRAGMIAATSSPLAVRAGLEALKQGGTAADAVLAHSLAQVVLVAGCCTSHAGIMTMVYYDAATARAYSMNAGWNSVRGEDDPLSIPTRGTPSGRSVLVPGFMAGVQEAHDRFGRLPFAVLFQPAIYFAEQGFPIGPGLARMIAFRREVLGRLPDSKKIFTRRDGQWHVEGDRFRQPQLAETLRGVAAHGADYMYRGEWAQKLVAAVAADGGKLTLRDLAEYEVIWSDAVHARFRGYDVYSTDAPSHGGLNLVEALNLVEHADLRRFGHYAASPEALFHLIRIARVADIMGTSIKNPGFRAERLRQYAPHVGTDIASRLTTSNAAKIWAAMQTSE